jgi:thioredoxin-like negative regulator of GroEL
MKLLKNKINIILSCSSILFFSVAGADDAQNDILNKVKNKAQSSDYRIKTTKELAEKRKGKHAILAIKSTSCSACNIADEAFAEIKQKFGDEVCCIESLIEFSPELKEEFDVTSVPTIVVFKKDKDTPVHTMRGANKNEILKFAHSITGKKITPEEQEKIAAQRKIETEQEQPETTILEKKGSRKKETANDKATGLKPIKNINEVKKAVASKKPVVLRIHSKSCPACKNSRVATESLAKKHSGKVHFIDAESSVAKDVAKHFEVTAVPTYVIFKNGVFKPIKTLIGADLQAIEKAII